jgi:serine/threonine protein kinase
MTPKAAGVTVERLVELLHRSQLLAPVDLEAVEDHFRRTRGETGDVARWTQWLVRTGYLTRYQMAMLLHGHLDAFFLGPYKLLDRIGRGNLAVVYKAADPEGTLVALKVLSPSKAREPRWLARFHNEAVIACHLIHPNIVRAFKTGEANGIHFLVLEYLAGENLHELLQRRGSLKPDELKHLARQTLHGLQYLYEQGFVHRNLEPSNLMLHYAADSAAEPLSATVKILDTSLSRSLFEESLAAASSPRLTHEGEFLGTPEYLAPEQAREPRESDIRADLYSLGCILFRAATGRLPFQDSSPIGLAIRHATELPQSLRETCADTPLWLERMVERLLKKEPGERFTEPAEAARALEQEPIATSSPSSTDAATGPTPALPQPVLTLITAPPAVAPAEPASVPSESVQPFSLPSTDGRRREFASPRANIGLYLLLGALGLLAAQLVGGTIAYILR